MTESTNITAPHPARLLDGACNHWHRHGVDLYEVSQVMRKGVERGTTRLGVVSSRHGNVGGPAFVSLTLAGGAFSATYRLTPDDAEAVAQWLQSGAAMAREVTAQVEAGACK